MSKWWQIGKAAIKNNDAELRSNGEKYIIAPNLKTDLRALWSLSWYTECNVTLAKNFLAHQPVARSVQTKVLTLAELSSVAPKIEREGE